MKEFFSEVSDFLETEQIAFSAEVSGEVCRFAVPERNLVLLAVPLETALRLKDHIAPYLEAMRRQLAAEKGCRTVFLYEDLWRSAGPLVRSRLLAQSGRFDSIYARNCDLKRIEKEKAARFLEKNHQIGAVKAGYCYGLFRRRSTGARESSSGDVSGLAAVSVFSPVRMVDGVFSAEWVRYCSRSGTRVVGGMGKMLSAFVAEAQQELLEDPAASFTVMSYSDNEWSDGEVYRRLGFEECGGRSPEAFLLSEPGLERIHFHKIGRDRRYREVSAEEGKVIYNCGSRRFLLKIR